MNLPSEWEPLVWTMGSGEFLDRLRGSGIQVAVQERHFSLDPLPAVALWRTLRRWRPDIVHAWGWMPAAAAGPMCRVLGIPCVDGMIRSGALEPDHILMKRAGMAVATLVVANSRAGLDAWGIGPRKGRVVPNGFDDERVAISKSRTQGNAGAFTVVMTGRMAPVKHFDLVLDAARRLSAGEAGWRFILLGDGPDRRRLIADAADLVARGTVVFPPPGLEVLDWVRGADAGVLMTNPRLAREGLSNSIMEYMALGLPVVCGDGGGNPELVIDGETGFVVLPDDANALADRLRYLRTHLDVAKSMGAAGRVRIAQKYAVGRMVHDMLRVYVEAIGIVSTTWP
jgi:glycosyltransferase involved in cell wall biosynthesis